MKFIVVVSGNALTSLFSGRKIFNASWWKKSKKINMITGTGIFIFLVGGYGCSIEYFCVQCKESIMLALY